MSPGLYFPAGHDLRAAQAPFSTAGTLEAQAQDPADGWLRVKLVTQVVQAPLRSLHAVQFLGHFLHTPPGVLNSSLLQEQVPEPPLTN